MAGSNILIFGGTGVIGKYLTAAVLEAKGHFGRIAVFTSNRTIQEKGTLLQPWRDQGLEIITGDISSEEDVTSAYKGFDTVISAVGRNVITTQIDLIRLAEASTSVKRFFPSEYGTDIAYFPHSQQEKPHQQKLKVRAYIKNQTKNLEYTYLVTGPYADLYIGKLPSARQAGSFDVDAKEAVLLGDGNGPISLTTMSDVGKLLVAALLHPEESRNRALLVNSFTCTPHDILEEFKRQSGITDWLVSYTPLEGLRRLEKQAWEADSPEATLYTLRRIWTEGGTLYEKRDNELIEAPKMDTLQKAVGKVLNSPKI